MTKRYLIGGPSNSGKSTLVLSLIERFTGAGFTAEAVEFDVWSNSYPAFRGEVTFKDRPKTKGLAWDWRTPLLERTAQFNASKADFVFGDLPGVADSAMGWAIANCKPDAAIVISRSIEGLQEWVAFFEGMGVKVEHRVLTFEKAESAPLLVSEMCRNVDVNNPGVITLFTEIIGK